MCQLNDFYPRKSKLLLKPQVSVTVTHGVSGGGRGRLAGDTDGLASWLVTVGVVSQPAADAEW